ncbi:MAG: hypothetical protein MRY64_09805 [Hyphomonadaceae bacterium]|nr:hypothetical protein [Hyphomonadaceae bacterium]
MTESAPIFDWYKDELSRLLQRLDVAQDIDVHAIERFESASREFTKQVKGELFIPKLVLWMMRSAMKTLRAEAQYAPNKQKAMLEIADDLEMTFDLVLLGEDHSDRIPGVPRVI